jgi:hypothetical protein
MTALDANLKSAALFAEDAANKIETALDLGDLILGIREGKNGLELVTEDNGIQDIIPVQAILDLAEMIKCLTRLD